jgi:putative transposase
MVKNHDIIAVEDLSISGMIQNRKLSRAISDAGWARFVWFLKYKSHWFGKHLVQIGRFMPSSKQCCSCGTLQDMPLCMRRYVCSCGLDMDRDLNASINIRAAGLAALNACGGNSAGFPLETRIPGFSAG